MERLRNRATLLVALLILALLLVAGPVGAQTVTPGQAAVDQLLLLVLVLALIIGGVVEALLIFAIVRYRRRPGFHLPSRVKTSDPRLEFVWTALPALVVAAVAGGTLYTLQITDTIPEGDIYIDVIAHQWFWEFVYPDQNVSDGLLRVQVNAVVVLNITSADVIHSFFIPEFRLKVDAIPGRVNQYWFQAEKAGEYIIECAEYCGVSHFSMIATLEVFPEGSQPLPYGPAS